MYVGRIVTRMPTRCPLYNLGGLAAILKAEREDRVEATQFTIGLLS